jgi:glycosyltransferase involved in cell wall biosynthesis
MKETQKTIIILSPGFAENEADSTCLPSQQQLVTALSEEFPSIKLIILAFQYPFSNQPYQWNGTTVIPFSGKNKGRLYRLLLWVRVWRQLNVLKKQYTITGLFSFWYGECTLIGKLFGKRNGIKHFTWLLGQDARKGNKYAKLLRPHAGELVALSDFLVEEFEKNYRVRPAHVIPIGIDPRLYPPIPIERDIDIMGAGSLIPLKRYDLLIEVVKALKKTLPHIQAVICGKGEEKNKLASMINEAELQGSITLIGEKSHAEVLQLMQRTKLFLHPSAYEGFGVVCLEALYAGAQVISFCDPKKQPIPHWHIAKDLDEMINLSGQLLHAASIDHDPILAYTMIDTARSVMHLFDHNEIAID